MPVDSAVPPPVVSHSDVLSIPTTGQLVTTSSIESPSLLQRFLNDKCVSASIEARYGIELSSSAVHIFKLDLVSWSEKTRFKLI